MRQNQDVLKVRENQIKQQPSLPRGAWRRYTENLKLCYTPVINVKSKQIITQTM